MPVCKSCILYDSNYVAFCIYWDADRFCILHFLNMHWFADIKKSFYPWNKSHLIIVWKWRLFSCVRLFVTPMDYKYHGILQARILELLAIPFSRVSSQLRDWTQVSRIAGRFFTSWATVYIKLLMYCCICVTNISLRMYVFCSYWYWCVLFFSCDIT